MCRMETDRCASESSDTPRRPAAPTTKVSVQKAITVPICFALNPSCE